MFRLGVLLTLIHQQSCYRNVFSPKSLRIAPSFSTATAVGAMSKIIQTLEPVPREFSSSIYVCTTPKASDDVKTALLKSTKNSVIFIPRFVSNECDIQVEAAVHWENSVLNMSDIVVFWLPGLSHEDIAEFPSLLLGTLANSGKVIYGCVPGELKEKSLRMQLARVNSILEKNSIAVHKSLDQVMESVQSRVKDAHVMRTIGERKVPLHVWKTGAFQNWYENIKRVGNRLDDATFEWTFRVGPQKAFVLFWVLHVNVYVAAEKRNKDNEVVISRPDISVILAYHRGARHRFLDTKVVLIREFRSPARTEDGYVWELPGGSSFKPNKNIHETARDELFEETGHKVEVDRVVYHKSRQLAATVTAHHAHLFSVELTSAEIQDLETKAQRGLALEQAKAEMQTAEIAAEEKEKNEENMTVVKSHKSTCCTIS
mmetsp:Transcript_18357/g.24225  ORF Transcript_18357/g.24225 Transcript_18357/m.24225 type:complete len:429 (-) Transcript_18357:120-1406(-)